MKKFIIFCLTTLLPFLGLGQGMIFDPAEFSKIPQAPTGDGSKSIGVLPKYMDLSPHMPPILDQGAYQICVPIATTVYAIGTQRAAAAGISNPQESRLRAFSPLHYVIEKKNSNCNTTSRLAEAAIFLKEQGGVPFTLSDKIDCQTIGPVVKPSRLIKIREVQWVFIKDKSSEFDIIYDVKKQLSEKRPVVVGLPIDENFRRVSWENPYYIPKGNLQSNIGHAVTVVGYDENDQSFKIANSYGTQWGKDGFFRMYYNDFTAYCHAGFVMHLYPETNDNSKNMANQQAGKFDFISFLSSGNQLISKTEVPKHIYSGYYELPKKDWRRGQQFQLHAENSNNGEHMGVFSINNKNQIFIHWPRDMKYNEAGYGLGESDLLGQNAKIIIPGSDSALIIDETGTDYLCIFYSSNPIKPELQNILQRLQASSGSILQRVQNALGSRLVKSGITYAPDKMEFRVTPKQGDIIPLILEVKSK
ncbi:MAG: C1 family peptidase [Spirosomataceae bacterium]